ncbi:AraC-like DNA-binding protein [Janthinobacterium sp. 67]|uniref:AraC family transcriptional regulator n=1 Tax=Janthinobacterium sp. 67 TaxID=2035207 RepID=UPI000C233244|nr:AraC family transcriptional regulator [Janthinobacterium sp. 67]PJJ06675.1 AraC-like DNA-binding protein [Janthinobacterium sp. 67]
MFCETEAGLLLSDRFIRIATPDLVQATPAIERLQGPFIARPKGAGALREPVRVRAADCGRVAVSTFHFGTNIEIEPRGLEGAILVTTAVQGRAGMAAGGRTLGASSGVSFISQEEDRPTFLYEPDTEVLKLRFERRRVEEMCVRMYDNLPDAPLHFDGLMAQPAAVQRWSALLRFVVSSLNAPNAGQPCRLETASMEELLMLTLLGIQPHNYQGGASRVRSVTPRQFRLAVDYINEHLDADITLAGIAEVAGCSIRSLGRAFQQSCGTSPMQYVQKLRLQRIRAELVRPASGDRTIADIAFHWGYRHLGEFNRKYRECFGETPSETRQRNLAHF